MRLDYQMQPIARVEIDATGAGRQQLGIIELGSMGKVELGRHRASPGLSQKPSKDAILTDLSFEINSIPLLDGYFIQKRGIKPLACIRRADAAESPNCRPERSIAAYWRQIPAILTILRQPGVPPRAH
ncbi:hypothetical protein [Achromobacter sp. Root170]|jgi:hypothetical protein|uniref:hypothetical protein n=1 Tax=Achromobacter sp. Root170 TaxID=1736480 RepID=UPI001F43ECB3|nr:hypothetical protein [Achromobacter sp. Root170]